jgi:hypothetical protein
MVERALESKSAGWNPRRTVQIARASARFENTAGDAACDGTGVRPTVLNSGHGLNSALWLTHSSKNS